MIMGGGGVGKTYIYRCLYHYARWKGLEAQNAAFAGIAANLLPHGRTMHNLFVLPVPLLKDSSSSIEHNTKAARELTNSSYILIDEVPAAHRFAMECGNRKMKELKGFNIEPEKEDLFGDHAIFMGKLPVYLCRYSICNIVF
jgi:hypothetical protein